MTGSKDFAQGQSNLPTQLFVADNVIGPGPFGFGTFPTPGNAALYIFQTATGDRVTTEITTRITSGLPTTGRTLFLTIADGAIAEWIVPLGGADQFDILATTPGVNVPTKTVVTAIPLAGGRHLPYYETGLLTELAVAVAGGGATSINLLQPFWGPAHLHFSCTAGPWDLLLESLDETGTVVMRPYFVTGVTVINETIVIPPRINRLTVTNNNAGAQSYNLSIIPRQV